MMTKDQTVDVVFTEDCTLTTPVLTKGWAHSHCTLAHFSVPIRGHTPHCGAQRLDLCSHMLSCGALEITYFVRASKILKVNANKIMFNTFGMMRRPNLQPHACKEGTLPLNYTGPLLMQF